LASKQRPERCPNNDLAPFLTWLKSYWELVGPSQRWDLQWGNTIHRFDQHLGGCSKRKLIVNRSTNWQSLSMDGRFHGSYGKKGGYIGHWIFLKGQNC
jgi:hypothetical protein